MKDQTLQVHPGHAMHRDIILMTLPLFLMSFFFYGPRPLVLAAIAVLTARVADRIAAGLRSRRYDATENSSVAFALIIVLMLPATVRFRVVIAAVLMAVLVAKEAFGGYQSYPFNPSAVGFCVVAVSWPDEVLRYPAPQTWLMNIPQDLSQLWKVWAFQDAPLTEGLSYTLKMGGLPNITIWDLLLGNYAGPLGSTASLVILACAAYLLVKKRINFAAPAFFLGTIALIAFFFPRFNEISFATWPVDFWLRLQVVKFEVLSGAMVFAAIFLLCEPGTLPVNTSSRIIYGVLMGLATMMFRYFGTYELGTCFAFLLVNAISGYFDRAISGRIAKKKGAVTP